MKVVATLVSKITFKSVVVELDRQAAAFHAANEDRNRKHFRIRLRAMGLKREAMDTPQKYKNAFQYAIPDVCSRDKNRSRLPF